MCSKCYRESEAAAEKKAADISGPPSSASTKTATEVPPPTIEESQPAPASMQVEEAPKIVEKQEDEKPGEEAAAAPVPMEEEEPPVPERPAQANRNRCFSCSKKVGLLGFECRCGYVYCSSHRHANDHKCTFDYAAMDRERLAKANPTIAADKVQKL